MFCNILALRKVVDIFEAFTPTASILGSLSLRALTDQSPSDDTIVAAAKEQSKAAAGKVAIAAAVRAALYPTAASAVEPIIDFSMSSARVDDKLAVLKYKYLCFLEFLQWCRHVPPCQLFHIPWPHGQEIELAVEARTVSFGKKELLSEPEWLSVMS